LSTIKNRRQFIVQPTTQFMLKPSIEDGSRQNLTQMYRIQLPAMLVTAVSVRSVQQRNKSDMTWSRNTPH